MFPTIGLFSSSNQRVIAITPKVLVAMKPSGNS